ncbi:MAG: hypothetical protein DRP93_08440 [Candidatus Neomarinimicrobiota bacterium]|nr:MAG: hypothetical protein DRP93_08440 [Candidatus Neomarinimicrobiota bacterium]
MSYENLQPEGKKKLPMAIKIHIIIFSFIVGLQLIAGIVEAMMGEPPILFSIWSIFTVIFFGLYMQLLKRKNWARIVIGILTTPLGLILLLSDEARSYCLQTEEG